MALTKTAAKDEIHFLASRRPALADGRYRISVEQQVLDGTAIAGDPFRPAPLRFDVSGPRFSLAASDILEVFPPKGSRGDYFAVLPHLVLERGTLPWERSADQQASPKPPWLALLLFTQDEIAAVSNTTLAALRKPPAGVRAPVYPVKPGDPVDAPVTVVQAAWGVLKTILPATVDLPFLAHARRVNQDDARAVVIANRLPEEGEHMSVHLVSLEDLYTGGAFFLGPQNVADNEIVQLVSLYSWDFFCQQDPFGYFEDLMNAVKPGPFRVGPAAVANSPAKEFLEAGFVPMIHRFRQGDTSVSWYHGPLVALDGAAGAPYKSHSAAASLSLPARCADELLLYHSGQGMLDVSYAAAWELGRLLILQNSRIATGLYQWKRERALAAASAARRDWTSHLAQPAPVDPATAAQLEAERKRKWGEIADWFETQLGLLEGVPFSYLAPDPEYVPDESLRFFAIDPLWIRCLWDGAFSIGRSGAGDRVRDKVVLDGKDPAFPLPAPPPMAGLMLRSAAVAGFPNALIDAYSKEPAAGSGPSASSADRLPLLRQEQLAPNFTIALFDTTHNLPAAVDFHLRPEALHFGVTISANATFIKGGLSPRNFRPGSARKVIDLAALAGALKAPAEQFGRDMIEGVPVIRFTFDPGGTS